MFNTYLKSSFFSYIIIILFTILSICIFVPILSSDNSVHLVTAPLSSYGCNSIFLWPTPGYNKITSYFGYRTCPTIGASNFHKGIDIAAPEGSELIAVLTGTVIFTDFYGSAGCTIMIQSNNFILIYSHVSPDYLVHIGDTVIQGQIIAKVGPKNIYGIPNNPYKDSNGNPTNGSTTGSHLHFSIKKDGLAVNPLDYIQR